MIDPALIKAYLSNMPPGKYHRIDSNPYAVCIGGQPLFHLLIANSHGHTPELSRFVEGCAATLVALLNDRDVVGAPDTTPARIHG